MKKLFHGLLALCLLLYLSAFAQPAAVEIRDAAGLAAIARDPGGRYALAQDIDMQGIPWTPIPFRGELDGQGHTLYNLQITSVGPDQAKTIDGNHKRYTTDFAALFSVVEDARITNLHLLGVDVLIEGANNCFGAGLAGYAENTQITGCSVTGRIHVMQKGKMGGVGGLVGFGSGLIADSKADVELLFASTTPRIRCEQFLGGLIAVGYPDILRNSVKLSGYASVRGYAHNGGLIGMYHYHPKHGGKHQGYVQDNQVDATIRFFEQGGDRRAYSKPFLGEKLHKTVEVTGNREIRFESKESKNYKKLLLPQACKDPLYATAVTSPTRDAWGYTTYTCTTCSYSYKGSYVPPLGQ